MNYWSLAFVIITLVSVVGLLTSFTTYLKWGPKLLWVGITGWLIITFSGLLIERDDIEILVPDIIEKKDNGYVLAIHDDKIYTCGKLKSYQIPIDRIRILRSVEFKTNY